MKSVFKYMPYRKEFFGNFYLKLSRFGEFNDPFELVPGSYGLSLPEEESKEFYSYSNKLLDPDYLHEKAIDIDCGARASVGVICFTTKEDNLVMWSHYAKNHEGICVEFNGESNFFNGKFKDSTLLFDTLPVKDNYDHIGVLREVEYSSKRPLFIDPSELSTETESWFVKSNEWKYEKEYRILLPVCHSIIKSKFLFYPIDRSMIKSVILGCQMPENMKQEVYETCKQLDISVKESFINSVEFKLDIIDYHPNNHGKNINFYNMAKVTK